MAVHLVNYAEDATPEGLELELGRRWKDCRRVTLLTPDGAGQELTASPTLSLPPFAIYAIVVVE